MRPVILGCFFLSGASGLVLEMLWTRLLTLVFGSTTLAVSTVLTAFMGGFVFLPTLGVRATNVVAAAFNLTLAATILIARRLPRFAETKPGAEAIDELLEQAAADGQMTAGASLPPPIQITPRARQV